MADTTTLHLSLEVDCGAEPITGRFTDRAGARWEFSGWMQLALVLEEALNAQRPDAGGRDDRRAPER